MTNDEECPNLTPEEQVALARDKEDIRVAINAGFRAALNDLGWRCGFLHYLTIEQQHRVQEVIDELRALFENDSDKFSEALGRGMVESIRKLPPVQ